MVVTTFAVMELGWHGSQKSKPLGIMQSGICDESSELPLETLAALRDTPKLY